MSPIGLIITCYKKKYIMKKQFTVRYGIPRGQKNIQLRYNKRECVWCEIKMKITKRKKRQNYIMYSIWYGIYNMKFGILKKTAENETKKCLDKI